MVVNRHKIQGSAQAVHLEARSDELRRLEGVFWVGSALSAHESLEVIFESDCQKPVDLFVLDFENPGLFQQALAWAALLKKNFQGFVLGRFVYLPEFAEVDQAYAAGVDLLVLPGRSDLAGEEVRLDQIAAHAHLIFPRWSVISMLPGDANADSLRSEINRLAALGILPIVRLLSYEDLNVEEVAGLYEHLLQTWRRSGAVLRPLYPLLALVTPLSEPSRAGLSGLLDKADRAWLRTTGDLRRLLRVRPVAQSYESAGL